MNEIENELLCAMCHSLLQNALSNACGHSFCDSCYRYNKSYHPDFTCPVCTAKLEPFKNLALQRVADLVRELQFNQIPLITQKKLQFTDSANDQCV